MLWMICQSWPCNLGCTHENEEFMGDEQDLTNTVVFLLSLWMQSKADIGCRSLSAVL
jgi:hypothetical protein